MMKISISFANKGVEEMSPFGKSVLDQLISGFDKLLQFVYLVHFIYIICTKELCKDVSFRVLN